MSKGLSNNDVYLSTWMLNISQQSKMLKTSNPHNLLGLSWWNQPSNIKVKHQKTFLHWVFVAVYWSWQFLTYLEQGMFYQKIQLKSNVIVEHPLNGDVWAPGDNLISLISDCAGHSVPSGFFAFNGRPAGNVGKMTTDNTITVQCVAQLMCSMLSNVSQVDSR